MCAKDERTIYYTCQHAPMEKSATFSQRMTMHHNKQMINNYFSPLGA